MILLINRDIHEEVYLFSEIDYTTFVDIVFRLYVIQRYCMNNILI